MNNPYRRSIRLAGADYTAEQAHFITICTANRQTSLGAITGDEMILSPLGRIADEELRAVSIHRPDVFLDTYVIMPDHMHAILFIGHGNRTPSASVDPQLAAAAQNSIVSTTLRVPVASPVPCGSSERSDSAGPQQAADLQGWGVAPQSLSAIVRRYKAAVTRRANELSLCADVPLWQPNYYDHIICDEEDLNAIRAYILTNPARWADDHTPEYTVWDHLR